MDNIEQYLQAMSRSFRADRAAGVHAIYHLQLDEPISLSVTVAVADQTVDIRQEAPARADVTIRMGLREYLALAKGELDVHAGYTQGRIRLSGRPDLARKFVDLFPPWADRVAGGPPRTVETTPLPSSDLPDDPIQSGLRNGGFDTFQRYMRESREQSWVLPEYPEHYGRFWDFVVLAEGEKRVHVMDSETFGRFTQRYFGGGGHDYYIHGRHSQVVASRYSFEVVLMQTVTARAGWEYRFRGNIVSFYKGSSGPRDDNKIFKLIGIDPTGRRDPLSPAVRWSERDGTDNEWRSPSVRAVARADKITVFIRLENTDPDVGETELNIIHLDNFSLE